MNPVFLLGLTALTTAAAWIFGRKLLELPAPLRPVLGRTLETIGLAVLFFAVNIAVTVLVVLGFRAFGVFVSMYAGNDPALIVLSSLQGVAFQSWRLSGR